MNPGNLLDERYRIEERLAEGPLYTTYQAVEVASGTRRLIKEAALARVPDLKSLELIEREAGILRNVKHLRIPSVVDSFRAGEGADLRWYLVREWAEGRSLAQIVRDGKRFTEAEALAFLREMAEILAYLHGFSPQVVHRDIKPANIILDDRGRPFLIDFDAIRNVLDRDPDMSGLTVVGTHGYMPYEQYSGHAVAASDVYALGLTAVAVMCGLNPLDMKQKGNVTQWQEHVGVSGHMRQLLRRMTEPRAGRRIRDGAQLLTEIDRVRAGRAPALPKEKALAAAGLVAVALLVGGVRRSYWLHGTASQRQMQADAADLAKERELRNHYETGFPRPALDWNANLLVNPGLEGPDGWEFYPHLTSGNAFQKTVVVEGEYRLALLKGGQSAFQEIDIAAFAEEIDAGRVRAHLSANLFSKTGEDHGGPYINLYSMGSEGQSEKNLHGPERNSNREWRQVDFDWQIPRGTRRLRLELNSASTRGDSNNNAAYYDNITLTLSK